MKSSIRLVLALAAAALGLAACMGEQPQYAGGVGEGGTGIVVGTTTGFGSVIVDGVRWDDRSARVEFEPDPRTAPELAALKLGQHVELEYEQAEVAQRIRIEARLIAPIDAIDLPAGRFVAVGQTVRINADPLTGPVTLFEGVDGLDALNAGDIVEVHGTPRYDSAAGRYLLDASRIEKRAALPAGLVRVTGQVQDYDPPTRSFRLGDLAVSAAGALVEPANRALANGQTLVVWSATAPAAGPVLKADFVRIRDRQIPDREAQLAGPVSLYDPANAHFEIGGIAVDARAATIEPATLALENGRYVVVKGWFGNDGTLFASKVKIRRPGSGDVEVELKGTITHFASAADFRVRGAPIDATAARLEGCPVAGLAADLYVALEGLVQGSRVVATKVECKPEPPPGVVIERKGRADAVDTVARRFTLTPPAGAPLAVSWTDTTLFKAPLTPQTLAASNVEVEGYFGDDGVFVARAIERQD